MFPHQLQKVPSRLLSWIMEHKMLVCFPKIPHKILLQTTPCNGTDNALTRENGYLG